MPRKPKKIRTATTKVLARHRPEDITVDQYNQGFNALQAGARYSEIFALTGMTKKQFDFLYSNALPGYETKCPGYAGRLAEIAVAQRTEMIEAAKVMSTAALRRMRNMDQVSKLAEFLLGAIVSKKTSAVRNVMGLKEGDDGWKPMHKLCFTASERQSIRTLLDVTDMRKMGEIYHKVFTELMGGGPNGMQLPQGTKVSFELDPEDALPASIAAITQVREAQQQEEEDFHQQLFRDFEGLSEEELEGFLKDGDVPASEKRRRKTKDDGPQEL